MTKKEMNRRISFLSPEEQARITVLINEGFGGQGIKFETGIPIKQINAMFQYVQG